VKLIATIAIALLVTACDEDKPVTTTTSAKPTVSTTADATTAAKPKAPTGVLSEEDFKALHVLRGDDAPPPKGVDISLSSSKAYLSLPKDAKPPIAGIVVIHEWWGLNPHIKHWADRLAEDGFATLAVDLYGGESATTPDDAMRLMKALDETKARAILKEAYVFLKEDERIKANKRGSIGWCMGGQWSLELALDNPGLDAAVVYYGQVETDPVRLAALDAPLLAFFGNKDKGIPPKNVDAFEFGLEQAGDKKYKIHRYDAGHAFANPSSARYEEKSAAAAWAQVRGFFGRELKASD
jgi:carboxymethylenebutenolidase